MNDNLLEWIESKYTREELLDILDLKTVSDLLVVLEDYIEAEGMDCVLESEMVMGE